jgi:hypothetical protein
MNSPEARSSEDVTEPLKGQFNTSIFYLLAGVSILGVPFIIGLLWLTNAVLPPEDAAPVKEFIFGFFTSTGQAIGAAGGIGFVLRSLLLTQGKITAQVKNAALVMNAAIDDRSSTASPHTSLQDTAQQNTDPQDTLVHGKTLPDDDGTPSE